MSAEGRWQPTNLGNPMPRQSGANQPSLGQTAIRRGRWRGGRWLRREQPKSARPWRDSLSDGFQRHGPKDPSPRFSG